MPEVIEINVEKLDDKGVKTINDALGKLEQKHRDALKGFTGFEKLDTDLAKAKAQADTLLLLTAAKTETGKKLAETFKAPKPPEKPKEEPKKDEKPKEEAKKDDKPKDPVKPPEPKPEPAPAPDLKPAEKGSFWSGVKNFFSPLGPAVKIAAGTTAALGVGYMATFANNPAGIGAGLGEGLKALWAHAGTAANAIGSQVTSFTSSLGVSSGSLATKASFAMAPVWLAGIAAGAAGLTLAGRSIRAIRKYALGKEDLPPIGWNPFKNVLAPFSEGWGLLKDVKNLVAGDSENKEVNGIVPTVWSYTGGPALDLGKKALKPTWLGAGTTALGGLVGGPFGAGIGYMAGNWFRNRSGSSSGTSTVAAAPAAAH